MLDSSFVVTAIAGMLRVLGHLRGQDFADRAIAAFQQRFVHSGWPTHGYGWVNLHLSRFLWRLRRALWRSKARNRRRTPVHDREPLRVGFVGRFAGLLSFPEQLFAGVPGSVALVVFDIQHGGMHARNLADHCAEYRTYSLDRDSHGVQMPSLISDVNGADLDVLVNFGWKREASDILDAVEAPCVMHYCTTSDLLHHPAVDVQLYWQPQADCLVRDRRLEHAPTGERFGRWVRQVHGYYDLRGIDPDRQPSWSARDSLIVFHGTLDKLASPAFLDALFQVMADESNAEFVFMGRDAWNALQLIVDASRRWGVESRTHYEGQFSAIKTQGGRIDDPGWARLLSYLARARLAPDPWPMGGGSSRFEAYAMGVPSVHMGLRQEPANWDHPQYSVCEVPSLRVASGTAYEIPEYHELCRRCLTDALFAEGLIEDQRRVVRRLSDPTAWWSELIDSYREWLRDGPGMEAS